MSLGNQGVFQLLKGVVLRRILGFYKSRKWGYFEQAARDWTNS
jgi:hypothetical protein